MPSWWSSLKSRPSTPSARSFRISDGNDSRLENVFILPTSSKLVKPCHTEPSKLPDPDASVHEVRFFLFRILTFKKHPIVEHWPQWVLETVAFWEGTGADLRAVTKFDALVPMNAGHAELDDRAPAERPSADCFTYISQVIGNAVKRLKANEQGAEKLQKEWENMQSGNSARQRMHSDRSRGFDAMSSYTSNPMFPHPAARMGTPNPLPSTPSVYSMQNPYANLIPTQVPLQSYYAPSIAGSMYQQVSPLNGFQPSDAAQMSAAYWSNSGTTHSTVMTSPPTSIEDGKAQSTHAPLTQKNLHHAGVSMPDCSMMDSCSVRSEMIPPHQRLFYPQGSQAYMSPAYQNSFVERLQSPAPPYLQSQASNSSIQRPRSTHSAQQPRLMHNSQAAQSSPSLHSRVISMHLNENHPRSPLPSIRSHQSSTSLRGTYVLSPQKTVAPRQNSMFYPNPSISAPRQDRSRVRTPSVARPVNGSIAEKFPSGRPREPSTNDFPVHQRPRIPVLDTFSSKDRSSIADQYALQQGSYMAFSAKDSTARHEVARREVERMHGMVPSNLRGDGLDPAGPTMRVVDPLTGEAHRTLYERIREKEVLSAKKR